MLPFTITGGGKSFFHIRTQREKRRNIKYLDTSWLAWNINGERDAEIKHYHCQEAHPLLAHVRRHLPVTKAISPCLTIDYHYVLHIPFLRSFDIFKSPVTLLLCWSCHSICASDEKVLRLSFTKGLYFVLNCVSFIFCIRLHFEIWNFKAYILYLTTLSKRNEDRSLKLSNVFIKAELNLFKYRLVPKMKLTLLIVQNIYRIDQLKIGRK